jgi:NADPH-dependent ferric siderophore reductase
MTLTLATVVAVAEVTSRMRRITLEVHDPAALRLRPEGDSAVGVYFDPMATNPAASNPGRNYTVRRHLVDGVRERIDLDVLVQGHGVGSTWANTTTVGAKVGLDHARSWYQPGGADWQLLVADLSGLPATARIVEQLPAGASVTALVEVLDDDDLDYLPVRRGVTVIPTVGTGNGLAASRLAEMVRAWPRPDGRGYCWFGGEAAESRAVRKYFRALGWSVDQLDVTGYWRSGSQAWDARFERFGDEAVAVYTKALADGKDAKVAAEEFDEALERAGL